MGKTILDIVYTMCSLIPKFSLLKWREPGNEGNKYDMHIQ